LSILSAFEDSANPVSVFEGAHQNRRNLEGAQDAQGEAQMTAFDVRPDLTIIS